MTSNGANIEPLRPAQIVARRVAEERNARGWSQEELRKQLKELGYEKSRSTLTKLEGGQYRGVSVDDVFALAAALGVNPVHLLTPREDDATVLVTPKVKLPARTVRAWIRGQITSGLLLIPEVDFTRLPESELRAMTARYVRSKLESALQGVSPLERSLMGIDIDEQVRKSTDEFIDTIRNPKEAENDG
jgi:transcriptional regulator with XRE-family HTH domain